MGWTYVVGIRGAAAPMLLSPWMRLERLSCGGGGAIAGASGSAAGNPIAVGSGNVMNRPGAIDAEASSLGALGDHVRNYHDTCRHDATRR
jgi:hypothetical protein